MAVSEEAGDRASPADSQGSPAPEATSTSKKRKSAALSEIEVDISLPEPPSKKARRALKKGKPLPKPSTDGKKKKRDSGAAGDDDDDPTLPEQLKGDATAKKERSEHGVWIGNLPFTVSRTDIFKWLVDSSGGTITEDSITRVNLPLSKNKPPAQASLGNRDGKGQEGEAEDGKVEVPTTTARENKGFAYVDFTTYEACIAAIALTECELGGRKLLIKNSKSFEGRPSVVVAGSAAAPAGAGGGTAASTAKQQEQNTNRKIYVGNLGFATTDDDLWAHFEKCGTIDWVKVATFEDSGKCKGYGWIKFAEPAGADWAVKGFVRIKEELETEEDFIDASQEEDNDDDGEGEVKAGTVDKKDQEAGVTAKESKGEKKGTSKKDKENASSATERITKTRKWWVNRLKGRALTIQFAEEDQVRYKKRFGKDASAKKVGGGAGDSHQRRHTARADGGKKGEETATTTAAATAATSTAKKPARAINYHTDINVARLTGAAVAPQGKKVTFD